MTKRHCLSLIIFVIFCILISCFVFVTTNSFADSGNNSRIGLREKDYLFMLSMARGDLSFAEGYFDTAIKNYKEAVSINPDSSEARGKYAQAILFKKLGVLMEASESG